MSELELTINRTIPASREAVFNAWLSPEILAKFMTTPKGGSAPARVGNDPVKSGRFSIVMMNGDKESRMPGLISRSIRIPVWSSLGSRPIRSTTAS